MNPYDMMPQWHLDRIAADEAREQREWEARLAEQADRADTMQRMAAVAESTTLYRTGHSSAELREAASNAAVAAELRDRQGEWGSASRTAVFVTGADGRVVHLKPRELAGGPVTVHADSVQAQLARSREVSADPFMAEQVARFDRRQAARSASVISRSEDSYGDLADCAECRALGATESESRQLHAQEAAERSQRPARQVPMIYR
jgi:hypothetical protein